MRFEPNKLERRLSAPVWQCPAGHVGAVRRRGRMWLVVETKEGTETFRVFGAGEAAHELEHALYGGGAGQGPSGPCDGGSGTGRGSGSGRGSARP